MSTFTWQGDPLTTIGDLSDAMCRIDAIEDEEERQRTADVFMEQYRAHTEHADSNIGYLTGYYGHDQMVRMLRLFATQHPIFGGPALADTVTQEGAFAAGVAMGEAMKAESQN